MTIDTHFTLDEHFKSVITKASVRQSILAKVANYHWGLEAGLLHITHNAVIGSILRYALVMTGSAMPPDLIKKMNTQIINIAARRVSGVSRTARIECLHFAINTATFLNLYVKHCAKFMDECVLAQSSQIRKRLITELVAYYEVTGFDTTDIKVTAPLNKVRLQHPRGRINDKWNNTTWHCKS